MCVYNICFCSLFIPISLCFTCRITVISMEWFFFSMILVVSLLQTNTEVYHIQPTNHNLSGFRIHYTLQEYINRTRINFYGMIDHYSNKKFFLLPGKHFLETDFIIQNANNFAMHGNNSIIYCKKPFLRIIFTKVRYIILNNIEIINCGAAHVSIKAATKSVSAVYLNQCTDVNVYGLSIMVRSGTNGMVAMNINASERNKPSVFQYVTITTYCTKASLPSSGMLFYYHDYYSKAKLLHCEVQVSNYQYKNIGLCKDSFALNVATNQTKFSVSIKIIDTNFNYLNNSGVLNYHGESCGGSFASITVFKNCSVKHNQGSNYLNLFHIVISYNVSAYIKTHYSIGVCAKQLNVIELQDCTFLNNSNMKSVLYALLQNSLSENMLINIKDSIFVDNYDTEIIEIISNVRLLWRVTHHIILINTSISSNRHTSLDYSLMSSANGFINFRNSVIVKNNRYKTIIRLYISVIRFFGYCEFSANSASFILDSKSGSYYILDINSTVNITKNVVHSIMKADLILNDESKPICHFQFTSTYSDLAGNISKNDYRVELIDNVHFEPKNVIQVYRSTLHYRNCTWYKNALFSSTNSSVVYSKVIKERKIYANKSSVLMTKLLNICPCINISSYNCGQRYIGTVFPGQTLTIKLRLITVQPFKISFIYSFSRTKKIPKACQLLNPFEIEQEHQSHRCDEHNYTIWSELPECELYLSSLGGITETLYVKLKACPAGFIICKQKRTCCCDPILCPYVTSCNLDDETILRPANSWVSAYPISQKYEYKVSKLCPYNHCLPHPLHLNLSMPDLQCQFHRTGMLCGQCQQGLSTIFGSSQCKKCSNFYLFIIIPIAVAGVVLVMMLFIFNLTVTSGTINTFIFYVNIISINYSIFFPECHSIDCLLLSLSNLDLGFEMCFYNGMDGYSKALLQLAFPLYLIFIAFVLIIASRHSVTIQRMTSQRALHVLATLFLLSYTKFLLTVCQVLFFYSEIIHLPSKHTTLVWSLDVSVQLFGVKFLIAFLICLVIFIILLHFNVLLLFARQLLRFKYINSFKPLLDAYFGPYKDNCFYWTGLQLILRAVCFGLSAFHRNVNLTSGIIVLGVLLCLQGLMHPFKSMYKNVQEALVILNLQAVYALALYSDDDSKANIQLMQALILLVLVYFIILVSYHCLMSTSTCSKVILKVKNNLEVLKDKIFMSRCTPNGINLTVVDNHISGNYHEFRDSLIALDN